MLTKGFLKPAISISNIGKVQFWAGLIFGIISALVFSLYFNYSRELFRATTFVLNPLIFSSKEFMIYDLFFAALSVSLAFGFTVIIWMTGRKNIKKQYYRMFAVGNSWLIIFVILFLILRMGSTLTFILYHGFGYDRHLDFIRDFWLILFILPVFVFFHYWSYIRLMFRIKYWIIISVLGYVILTFIIFKTTSIDKSTLNNIYYFKNRNKFEFIESELESKSKLYGITFSDSTKEMLKKYYSDKTFNLVKKLKKAFDTDSLVSVDTLILEKIVIHNLNIQGVFINRHRSNENDINWPYATPEQIYTQIKRYDSKKSYETKLLIDILNEMIDIFSAPDIDWEHKYKYSNEDMKRYAFKRQIGSMEPTIESRLAQVVIKLRYDKDNELYRHQLTRMKIEK